MSAASKFQSWIITAAVALGALAYAWFVFLPGQAAIGEMRTELQNKTDYLLTATSLPAQIADTERRLRETHDFIAKGGSQVPDEAQLEAVVRDITRAARNSGVRILRLEPQAKSSLEKLVQMPVIVGVQGKFAQMHDWLGQIESLEAAIWVDEIRLHAASGTGQNLECEAKITVFADRAEISH